MTADEPDGAPREVGAVFPPADFFLELMLNGFLGDSPSNSFSLTLYYGGAIVSGDAISLRSWLAEWLNQVVGAGVPITDDIRQQFEDMLDRDQEDRERAYEEGLPVPRRHFVNMRNVRVYVGDKGYDVGVWRGRVEQIDGWSLGKFTPA